MNAAIPAIRDDLGIGYKQVGLLLGLPAIIGTFVEPIILLLGDTRLRKPIMNTGGLLVSSSFLLISYSPNFYIILLALIISYPASGAFVSLSQATLMDQNQGQETRMMARWTVVGSLGNLIGPLLIAASFTLLMGWRWIFVILALAAGLLTLAVYFQYTPVVRLFTKETNKDISSEIHKLISGLWKALGNLKFMRWIILLQLSDLMLAIFTGYVALYFADIVGLDIAQIGILMSILMAAGFLSDLSVIPLLERFPGRLIVRISALITGILYVALLILPWPWIKIIIVILLQLSNIGWYQVLQGEAYAALPRLSGTVTAISSAAGLLGGAIAFCVGWIASWIGLSTAMWILIIGPISLLLFVPKAPQIQKSK